MKSETNLTIKSIRKIPVKTSLKFNSLGGRSRVVPKDQLYERQQLYIINLNLREKIKQLTDQNIKLNTRLNIQQKEKKEIIFFSNQSIQSTEKPSLSDLLSNKRIFRNAKNQIEDLKIQINQLKKSTKYTDIKQLQIQNQVLHQQIKRLAEIISNFQNKQQFSQEYVSVVNSLKKSLKDEKQRNQILLRDKQKQAGSVDLIKQQMDTQVMKVSSRQKMALRNNLKLKQEIQKLKVFSEGCFKSKVRIEECSNCTRIKTQSQNDQKSVEGLKRQIQIMIEAERSKDKEIQIMKKTLQDKSIEIQNIMQKKAKAEEDLQKSKSLLKNYEEKYTQFLNKFNDPKS